MQSVISTLVPDACTVMCEDAQRFCMVNFLHDLLPFDEPNLFKSFEYSRLHFMRCPAHANGVVHSHVSFGQVWLHAF